MIVLLLSSKPVSHFSNKKHDDGEGGVENATKLGNVINDLSFILNINSSFAIFESVLVF
jgi:hypothetical protein